MITQINDLTPISNLQNLLVLVCSSTLINDLAPISDLQQLQVLYCRSTQISDLRPIISLKALVRLDVRGCRIATLPKEMLNKPWDIDCETIQRENIFYGELPLAIGNNPIENPPLEILSRGREEVEKYYQSSKGELIPLNEGKVILVGEGGAGKTSLLKRLRGEKFDPCEEMTHGINIEPWKVEDENETIRMKLWDFGGQQIMHATHQLFLSKRSIYILVLDGRKEEQVEHWIKQIESFGGNSPILIVQNKSDQHSNCNFGRHFLKNKYKGIVGFYPLSCETKDGVDCFIEALQKEVKNLPLRRTSLYENWHQVKRSLEELSEKEDYITNNQFKKLCVEQEVNDTIAQDTLLQFLHDLGVVLHFPELKHLETQILNPSWITEGIYALITSPELERNRGNLSLQEAELILKEKAKNYDYTNRIHFVIEAMSRFELCYKIDEQRILIPSLLPVESKIVESKGKPLTFIYQYNFFPESIIPRFIVKTHKDIHEERKWRTGVVLRGKIWNATAIVQADREERKIKIEVIGEQKRDYFATIRDRFTEIHEGFEKLEVEQLIPLPDNPERLVNYEVLISHEVDGIDPYYDGITRRRYPVSQLLNGVEAPEKREERTERLRKEFNEDSSFAQIHGKPRRHQKIPSELNESSYESNSPDLPRTKQSPIAFFSYASFDDEEDQNQLTAFKTKLESEIRTQTGDKSFNIFQDRGGIKWGEAWRERLDEAIDQSTFLIVIVTPAYLKSEECRKEFNRFLKQEEKLNRSDLILPILYVKTAALKKESQNPIVQKLNKHQMMDWHDLRFKRLDDPIVRERIAEMAEMIAEAIDR